MGTEAERFLTAFGMTTLGQGGEKHIPHYVRDDSVKSAGRVARPSRMRAGFFVLSLVLSGHCGESIQARATEGGISRDSLRDASPALRSAQNDSVTGNRRFGMGSLGTPFSRMARPGLPIGRLAVPGFNVSSVPKTFERYAFERML